MAEEKRITSNELKITIIKKVEDLLQQCLKIDKTENTQKCAQLLQLINENSHTKAIHFYHNKIESFWETIKQDIKKDPFELKNSLFVFEKPLEVDFGRVIEKSSKEQKIILGFHFRSVASLIWPSEFDANECQNREEELIDTIFHNIALLEHANDTEKTAGSVLKNISANSDLMDATKEFLGAIMSRNINPNKILEYILKKVEIIEKEKKSDENVEELKTIVHQMKDKPCDLFTAFDLIRQLSKTNAFKYFKNNQKEILDNIPNDVKCLVDTGALSDVVSFLNQECVEENSLQ
jgi:hypothetical protein